MSAIDGIVVELDQEARATRRLLERVPEDKLGWKPHAKSFSLGQLALHVATIQGQVSQMAGQDSMDLPKFQQPQAASRAELLKAFDENTAAAKANLAKFDDNALGVTWTLRSDGKQLMAVPRGGMLRSIMLNHLYHHRGQLTVYLRLLDVPLPSVYGPSADENPFA